MVNKNLAVTIWTRIRNFWDRSQTLYPLVDGTCSLPIIYNTTLNEFNPFMPSELF